MIPSARLCCITAALSLVAAATASAAAADRHRCGTVERLAESLAARRSIATAASALPGGAVAKQTRDGFGGAFEVRESDNFALKWTDAPMNDDVASRWLEGFERSFRTYHEEMGYPPSIGADQFRINVYVHGADDTPGIDFSGGYVTLDNDGHPYVVIAEELVGVGEFPIGLIAHEYFHVVQMGTASYETAEADWYWEASAEWASQQWASEDTFVWSLIGAYAAAPELPVSYFGDFLAGDEVTALHQYGASIFVRYLSERFGVEIVRDSWLETQGEGDPLAVLDRLTDAPLETELFADFAARNAYWDYRDRAAISAAVNEWSHARTFPRVGPEGTGWAAGDADHPLGHLGWTRVELEPLADSDVAAIAVAPAGLAATVVRDRGGELSYRPLEAAGDRSEVELELAPGDRATLIIARTKDGDSDRFQVAVTPGSDIGGCSTGGRRGSAPAIVMVVLAMLFGWRRRRDAAIDRGDRGRSDLRA